MWGVSRVFYSFAWPGAARCWRTGRGTTTQRCLPLFLSLSVVSLFSPSHSFACLPSLFLPRSVSRILSVRLPTAKATLGRNPNSVAKRLRRIAPTPICISFVLEREIFCVSCFIKSGGDREDPRPLPVFRDYLPFHGEHCIFKLLYFQSLSLHLYFNTSMYSITLHVFVESFPISKIDYDIYCFYSSIMFSKELKQFLIYNITSMLSFEYLFQYFVPE